MSPLMVGGIGMIALLVLMGLGLSIGATMMLIGFLGLCILISPAAAFSKFGIIPFEFVSSYDYAVIPMFILMANVILVSGLGTDLFNIASKWLGRFGGGMAMATTAACAGFAAISGSGLTTALTIGSTALPEMKRYNYDTHFSAAVIAASGTIGLLIPPSAALMVYGIVTGNSIKSLFMAGFIPGITQALFYIVLIAFLTKKWPHIGPSTGVKTTFREKFGSLRQGGEVLTLIIFVFVGMLLGWFTPTEAGAMGVTGGLVITIARRRMDWKRFKTAIVDTIKVSGMYYVILMGAQVFMYFSTVTTFPTVVAGAVGGLSLPPMMIMVVIILIYMVLGCFMSGNAMMMLTIPIFYPLILELGFNPIWFGVILTRVTEIGQLTPPVGLVVYSMPALDENLQVHKIFKWTAPFVGADFVHTILMLVFPSIVLFLPNLVG